jgi:predicted RNase H-like nuclease (RuvC/YqgF family)
VNKDFLIKMSDIKSLVSNLEKKVEKLVDLHRESSKSISTLKQNNNELKKNIEEQKQTIKELEEKNKILRLSKSISDNNENTHELKLKINELIREIDKCTALLNK